MEIITEGRFGRALRLYPDAPHVLEAPQHREYMLTPLTVECRVRLFSRGRKNVFLADGYPILAYTFVTNHWALFSTPGEGLLGASLLGMKPAEIATQMPIADGDWHFITLVFDLKRVWLHVDGVPAADVDLAELHPLMMLQDRSNEGPLYFGSLPQRRETCDGALDEVRISRVRRDPTIVPTAPLVVDPSTISLWQFSAVEDGYIRDLSPTANHLRIIPVLATQDANDRQAFGIKTDPFNGQPLALDWQPRAATRALQPGRAVGAGQLLLDGAWDCVGLEGHGADEDSMADDAAWRIGNADNFTCQANVPCTIQAALFEAGVIEDPVVAKNNLRLSHLTDREWWLRRRFTLTPEWRDQSIRLHFDGVDYRATFWLNGERLGTHEGMFGGPDFDVSHCVYTDGRENVLLVCIEPAPMNYEDTFKNNVAYGWHYVKLITLGIWRSVWLERRGTAALNAPFLRTRRITADAVEVDLGLEIVQHAALTRTYRLELTLTPRNFIGSSYHAEVEVSLQPGCHRFCLAGALTDAHLWWPNGLGSPDLYQFECILRDGDRIVDYTRESWGARTIEMRPAADDPRPNLYNWQFVINGRPLWIKGANWCYPDLLLRLDRRRQERFVTLARHAHIQLLRVWGGGPIENDALYDLCDEQGLLVLQEFAMLGFHRLQNLSTMVAGDMTHHMIRRLRNRPSLAMWAAANEIYGQGRIVEYLGRRCLELDGTRPFHRSTPYGGDVHWYGVYWENRPLLDYRPAADGRLMTWSPLMDSPDSGPIAFTEFGLSSPANIESWRRIIPSEEWEAWPPRADSCFLHHTPTYDSDHILRMQRYAGEFLPCASLPELIEGMQLAQGLGAKIMIESMRARKPATTATFFYKLTENYPGCSWATIDYFGVPKRAHYAVREAYQPIHVLALFDAVDDGKDVPLSIFAVNDTGSTVPARVGLRIFNAALRLIGSKSWDVDLPHERALLLGDYTLSLQGHASAPCFVCLDWVTLGDGAHHNFYAFNFAAHTGILFRLPATSLAVQSDAFSSENTLLIRNTGELPALCVELDLGEASNWLYAEDSGFWLDAGEERHVRLLSTPTVDGEASSVAPIRVKAWNAAAIVLAGCECGAS
jgi:beta-mannosidase